MGRKRVFAGGLIVGVLVGVVGLTAFSMSGSYVSRYLKNSLSNVVSSDSTISGSVSDHYKEIEDKLNDIQSVINMYYMTDETVTSEKMIDGIYKGYINSLGEPYTVYYNADEYNSMQESTSGKYSGIGVVLSQDVKTGIISVVRPFDGSPGKEAGMMKDDRLSKVEGKEVTGLDISEVVTWIKGEEGTKVNIEVYRPSTEKYLTFEVERRQIEVPMVESRMLDGDIGYAAILEFEETTYDQFDKAVDALEAQGMKGLIIDLRDNPGGLVTSAKDVLDRILPADKLLVYTVDKYEDKEEIFSEDDDEITVPIVVLINENSASASEIVSGALQDYEKAALVGTTSFGKGIVQYILPLGDGSAVKVTAAKYYTPNGRNIHGTGLEPDVVIEQSTETVSKEGADTEKEAVEEADVQLDEAVKVINEKVKQ